MSEVWLFVDAAVEFGGHEVMLTRWIEELRGQGEVACRLMARRDSRLRRHLAKVAVEPGFSEAPRAGRWRLLRRVAGELGDAWKLAQALRRVRPRLCVVAEGFACRQPLLALVARLLGVKLAIYTPLVDGFVAMGFRYAGLRDALVRHWLADLPHAWITITAEQASAFRAWTGVRRPVYSIPNTVAREIEQLAAPAASVCRSQERPGTATLGVLVLGRLDAHQKGLDMLLDYLAASSGLSERLHVQLVGEGAFRDEIERRLATLPRLSRWVSLSSWRTPQEAMLSRDVLLIPSRYEGVPLVMLEAMAFGLPVVAADLPGTRAFLDAACLFPVGNMQCAFDRVLALRDPALQERVVAGNRATFRRSASGEAFAGAVRRLTADLRTLHGSA